MIESILIALKYVSWLLGVGIAFAGTWVFDFTRTDKETGRKVLTKWGRHSILLAGLSVLAALVVTVLTDVETANKNKLASKRLVNAEEEAKKERKETLKFQESSQKHQSDTLELVRTISENFNQLGEKEKENVQGTLRKLNTVDDLRVELPDLYAKLVSSFEALNFSGVFEALNEALARLVEQRISKSTDCADLPLRTSSETVYRNARVMFSNETAKAMEMLVGSDSVRFGFVDYSGDSDFSQGIVLKFTDDSGELRMRCSRTVFGCENDTLNDEARDYYKILQQKEISSVRTRNTAAPMKRRF